MNGNELIARVGQLRDEYADLFALATFTDEVRWFDVKGFLAYATEERRAHLLELRVFNAQGELHATRDVLNAPFNVRGVWGEPRDGSAPPQTDEGFTTDERHLLDVDETRTDGCSYQTTTGGPFELPVANVRRVHLRNYWTYDADGMAAFSDFRIVGFEGRE